MKQVTDEQLVKAEAPTGLSNEALINRNFQELFADELPTLHVLTVQLTAQREYCRFMQRWLSELLTDLDANDLGPRLAKRGYVPLDYKERLTQALAELGTVLKEAKEGNENV